MQLESQEEKREKATEVTFEDKMAENVTKLMKVAKSQIQETQ